MLSKINFISCIHKYFLQIHILILEANKVAFGLFEVLRTCIIFNGNIQYNYTINNNINIYILEI